MELDILINKNSS